MKGKSAFTLDEVAELRRLIDLRVKSERSAQKLLRDRMREIGLYGRDDWGITDMKPEDFESLITSGRIVVIDKDKK